MKSNNTLPFLNYSFKFFFEARSGGFVELTRINDGSITGTEFYNGSLITGKVEFHFDFDVPVHCFDSSSCSDPPLVLLQDVTKVKQIIKVNINALLNRSVSLIHVRPTLQITFPLSSMCFT